MLQPSSRMPRPACPLSRAPSPACRRRAESIDYGLDANPEEEGEEYAELEVSAWCVPRRWLGCRGRAPAAQPKAGRCLPTAGPGAGRCWTTCSAAADMSTGLFNAACTTRPRTAPRPSLLPTLPLAQAAAKPLRHGYDHVLAEKVKGSRGQEGTQTSSRVPTQLRRRAFGLRCWLLALPAPFLRNAPAWLGAASDACLAGPALPPAPFPGAAHRGSGSGGAGVDPPQGRAAEQPAARAGDADGAGGPGGLGGAAQARGRQRTGQGAPPTPPAADRALSPRAPTPKTHHSRAHTHKRARTHCPAPRSKPSCGSWTPRTTTCGRSWSGSTRRTTTCRWAALPRAQAGNPPRRALDASPAVGRFSSHRATPAHGRPPATPAHACPCWPALAACAGTSQAPGSAVAHLGQPTHFSAVLTSTPLAPVPPPRPPPTLPHPHPTPPLLSKPPPTPHTPHPAPSPPPPPAGLQPGRHVQRGAGRTDQLADAGGGARAHHGAAAPPGGAQGWAARGALLQVRPRRWAGPLAALPVRWVGRSCLLCKPSPPGGLAWGSRLTLGCQRARDHPTHTHRSRCRLAAVQPELRRRKPGRHDARGDATGAGGAAGAARACVCGAAVTDCLVDFGS